MKGWPWIVAVMLWAMLSQAYAAGDAAAGRDKANACRGCHGDNGVSTDVTVPKLAGQFAGYIYKQLHDFQALRRTDERMPHTVATATTQDLQDIATYFAAQPMMKGSTPKDNARAQVGKAIYENGVPERDILSCVGCHGAIGKGAIKSRSSWDDSFYPVIGGQHRPYLVKQLNDLRGGMRKNDLAGIMTGIAKALTPDEIEALSEYLAGL